MKQEPKVTGSHSQKPYRCTGCGREEQHDTNHWGEIYPHCRICGHITIWECLEPLPAGYTKPQPWRIVKLGDVAEIHLGRPLGDSHERTG